MRKSRLVHASCFVSVFAVTVAAASCNGTPDHAAPLDENHGGGLGSDASLDHAVPGDSAPDTAVHDAPAMDAPTDAVPVSDAPFDAAECSDGVKDGTETDKDCGGLCPPCQDSLRCAQPTDCKSEVCTNFVCQVPSCTDGVPNGNETDADCGGPNCSPCADLKKCKLPTDCVDKICTNSVCSLPTCTDSVKNGQETDTDCGGSSCPKCIIGKTCKGAADCQSNVCNGTCQCPTGMVIVPVNQANGGDYCIDAFEVTKAAYNQFLQQNPPLNTQIPTCSWNATYTPGGNWPPVLTLAGYTGGEPVQNVDWCDAYAYCTTIGKHLCGQIGTGGAIPQSSYNDATKDQWYDACSAQGQNVYPFGSGTFKSCDTPTGSNAVAYELDYSGNINGNMIACQGGSAGIYMMSGNVAEWENSCDTAGSSSDAGQMDNCLLRGGSVGGNATTDRCDALLAQPRNYRDPSVGFRCCL